MKATLMEIRHLRYFLATAEEVHFGRAAARLHIAQPALSRQIRNMEEELGFELFERLSRGVALSPMGEEFLIHARRLVADFDHTCHQAQRVGRGETGRLSVGFIEPACLHRTLPDSFRKFRAIHPEVTLELSPMHSTDQLVALQQRQIDAGVVYSLPGNVVEFDHRTILALQFKLAVPVAHPLASREDIRLADLRDENFIWLRRNIAPAYADHLLAACMAGGLSPNVIQETNNESTILSLVSVGMGLGIVISSAGRIPEGIILKSITDLTTLIHIYLVWRRADRSLLLERLIDIISHNSDIKATQP